MPFMPSATDGTQPRVIFFTGTDTGVGKTTVVCAVARTLRQMGRSVGVCKPIATGAERTSGGWIAEDTRLLADAIAVHPFESTITRWTFTEPLAPNVAARRAGVTLELTEIANEVRQRIAASQNELFLIEGVGGLLCPLTDSATIADLIATLGVPLVIVSRRSLGTLNHTLLTLEVARGRGLDVRGVIVNETEPPDGLADQTNLDELSRLVRSYGVPILGLMSHRKDETAGMSMTDVDWWNLAEPTPQQL